MASPARRFLKERLREDRGALSVEFAVIFPAALFMILGAMQACLVYYANSVALASSQEAVNATRVMDGTAEDGRAAGRQFAEQAGHDSFTITSVTVSDGAEVTATVTGEALSVFPGLTFSVSETSSGSKEQVSP